MTVAQTMPNEFEDEDPTTPEATETLAETVARLTSRCRTSTRDRPAIRSRTPTPTENQ